MRPSNTERIIGNGHNRTENLSKISIYMARLHTNKHLLNRNEANSKRYNR